MSQSYSDRTSASIKTADMLMHGSRGFGLERDWLHGLTIDRIRSDVFSKFLLERLPIEHVPERMHKLDNMLWCMDIEHGIRKRIMRNTRDMEGDEAFDAVAKALRVSKRCEQTFFKFVKSRQSKQSKQSKQSHQHVHVLVDCRSNTEEVPGSPKATFWRRFWC